MGREIGTAYISILPSASQLGPAIRQQLGAVQRQTATGGAKSGRSFVSGFSGVAKTGLAAIGIAGGAAMVGGIAKNAVDLEASFSKTMNTMAAVAGVPAAGIKDLSALAMKMGADTVFSANEAADAMLELAKGGLTAAQIKAGALKATLTLAAAGGIDLATAATDVSNALNTFGLQAKDADSVAAALAGGANASSASVDSLGQALSQVGPGAHLAGLSIQETVAALAAFDNAGIKGSDAGTSLKTMLMGLSPQTKTAVHAMEELNLMTFDVQKGMDFLTSNGVKPAGKTFEAMEPQLKAVIAQLQGVEPGSAKAQRAFESVLDSTTLSTSAFINAKGEMKSLPQVAGILQKSMKGLTKEQQQNYLTTIFGTDAYRAAAVLTEQGAAGIQKYVSATNDQNAAQRAAQAGMKGTAGAIEQMKGSIETAELALGQLLAPAVALGANLIAEAFNKITPAIAGVAPMVSSFGVQVQRVFDGFSKGGGGDKAIGFFDRLKLAAVPVVAAVREQVSKLLPSIVALGPPILSTAQAIGKFAAALLPTIRKLVVDLVTTLGPGLKSVIDTVRTQFLPAFQRFLPILLPVAKFLLQMFGSALIGLIQGAAQAIKGFVTVIAGVMNLVSALVHGDWSKAWAAVKQIVKGALDFVIGAIKVWWNLGVLALFRRGVLRLLTSWRGLFSGLKKAGDAGLALLERLFTIAFAVVKRTFSTTIKNYIAVWKALFTALLRAAKNGWSVLRSAFGGALAAIKTTFSLAVRAVKAYFSGLFTALKTTARAGWAALKSGANTALTAIKNAFRTAVSGIGKVWEGLKEAAAKPVRFIISTVYTHGIKPVVDALPGVPNLPSLTPAFAKGGPVTGGVRGKDSVNALLMPGEHVLTTEEVKRFGGQGAIFRLRAMIRNGLFDKGALKSGGDLGYDMPRFAKGGALTSEQVLRAQQFAKSQVGKPYVWGGYGPHGYDCSGFMSAITNVLRGNSPYSRVGSTASFPWSGFEPGPGQFTIGSTNNYGGSGVGHMAGTLGGMRVESYGGHGVSITHRGYNDPGFRTVAHLGAGGAAAAKAGHWWDAIGQVKDAVKAIPGMLRELSHMGGWGGLARKMVGSIGGDLRKFVNGKIPGPGPIPGGIFDTGGVLEPGTFAYNASKKPEAVFTHRQFEGLADDVRGRRGGAAPVVGSLTITPNTGETTRDAMEEALFQLRRLQRGGRA